MQAAMPRAWATPGWGCPHPLARPLGLPSSSLRGLQTRPKARSHAFQTADSAPAEQQGQLPRLLAKALLDPWWDASNISVDALGTLFVSIPFKGVQFIKMGRDTKWVQLGSELDAEKVCTSAISPDGCKLFIDTWEDGIWEQAMHDGLTASSNGRGSTGGSSSRQVVPPSPQGLGEAQGNDRMPYTLLCTENFLYFWRVKEERLHLYSLHTASGQVQLAFAGPHTGRGKYPSWALDEAAGVVYLKPDREQDSVLRVELQSSECGACHVSAFQLTGRGTLRDALGRGEADLGSCTAGDGSLLVCAAVPEQHTVYVLPSPPKGATAETTSVAAAAGPLRLLVGGCDSAEVSGTSTSTSTSSGQANSSGQKGSGSITELYGPRHVAVDAHGHLWLHDDDNSDERSVLYLLASLQPPPHLAAPWRAQPGGPQGLPGSTLGSQGEGPGRDHCRTPDHAGSSRSDGGHRSISGGSSGSQQLDVHCALAWLAHGHTHGEAELKQLALGYAAANMAEIMATAPGSLAVLQGVDEALLSELRGALEARMGE